MDLQFKEHIKIKYFFKLVASDLCKKKIKNNMRVRECAMHPDTAKQTQTFSLFINQKDKGQPWGLHFSCAFPCCSFAVKYSGSQGSQTFHRICYSLI